MSIIPMPVPTTSRNCGADPPRKKRASVVVRFLTRDEMCRFRKAVLEHGDEQDAAMYATWYRYGLRISEIADLQVTDVDLDNRRIFIRRAKGGDSCWYPITPDVRVRLRRWLQRHQGTTGWKLKNDKDAPPRFTKMLFYSRNCTYDQGWSLQQLTLRFRDFCMKAGVPYHGTHSLRHTCAVHALEAGASLEQVSKLLGHKDLASAKVYAKISDPARDFLIAKLSGAEEIVRW